MTPDQIAALTEACILITQPLTEELLRDICRRVAEAGQISSTAQYQVLLAKSLGLADGAIVDALHKQEVLTERAIDDLMEYAAKNTVLFEDDGGLQKTIKAYSEMAKKEAAYQLGNLAATTVGGKVYPLRDAYRKAMDYAFRQSITGALTPTQAVRRATRELASRGIRTIEQANGRSISLENAVRRTILNQMGQLVEKVSEQNHDELECDGWEISAHSGSAPDHEPYQGRQYPDEKYEALNSRLQRRIGTLSCKHLAFPIVIGVNAPQYTEEQLQQMAQENAQGITYEGRHYTQYEASQMQRDIENNIRMLKNRVLADKENKDSSQLQIDQIRLNVLNEQYNRFSSAAGLRTAPERLLIGGFTSSGKVKSAAPILGQKPFLADDFKADDGTFDIDAATKAYREQLDLLTDMPEKNKMYLDYYTVNNPTAYVKTDNDDFAFAYSIDDDTILYNPAHPNFGRQKLDEDITHEQAHRIDFLNTHSAENDAFKRGIETARLKVQQNGDMFSEMCHKLGSIYLSDIIDALAKGDLNVPFGHGKKYWHNDTQNGSLEIFANIFSMEALGHRELEIVKAAFSDLWESYQKLL